MNKNLLMEDLKRRNITFKKSDKIDVLLGHYGLSTSDKKSKFQSIKIKTEELKNLTSDNFLIDKYKLSKNETFVTIIINGHEIPKYHRNRSQQSSSNIMYDPLSTYKKIFRRKLLDVMKENNIDVKDIREDAIEMELHVYKEPISSKSKKDILYKLLGLIKRINVPDVDNFEKTGNDLLNDIMFKDDCQIFKSNVTKSYSTSDKTVFMIHYNKQEPCSGPLTKHDIKDLKKQFPDRDIDSLLKYIKNKKGK
jgi:Holliday junction resolvase RusA-like endonuclease